MVIAAFIIALLALCLSIVSLTLLFSKQMPNSKQVADPFAYVAVPTPRLNAEARPSDTQKDEKQPEEQQNGVQVLTDAARELADQQLKDFDEALNEPYTGISDDFGI